MTLSNVGPRSNVTVELSRGAAEFLRGTIAHINERKILPPDNPMALQTSAWLEEIDAATWKALGADA